MKHVLTSAGILALGAATLHAYDPEMTRQLTGRPWTVAATVRGFYDDNVTTSPDRVVGFVPTPVGPRRVVSHPRNGSFGAEISPSAHLNIPLEQTFIALGYIYSLRWYEDRDPNEIDQSHEFNAKLRHQFNPRHQISINESFIVTSEPTVADRFGIVTAPVRTRTESDVLHNHGGIEYMAGLSQRVALGLGYANDWYDYEQEGPGSRSALLDRIQHLIRADARYQISPTLVGLVGYSFCFTTFEGDDFLLDDATRFGLRDIRDRLRAERDDFYFPPSSSRRAAIQRDLAGINNSLWLMSEDRNSYSHYGYVGGDYDLTAQLRASARVGGQFTHYSESGESVANPYADASLTYVYLPGSSVEFGVRHHRNATDISTPDRNGLPTLDAESTAVYLHLIHRITDRLTGSLLGQYQNSCFNFGQFGGETEELYLAGVNFNYSFNRHFSAEIGYNYDLLCSDVPGRSYDRNRYYVGFRATY